MLDAVYGPGMLPSTAAHFDLSTGFALFDAPELTSYPGKHTEAPIIFIDIDPSNVMNRRQLLVALFIALFAVSASSTTTAEEKSTTCVVEAVPGGIECVADDDTLWAIEHPGLWPATGDYPDPDYASTPVGPVEFDGSYFYAAGRDLLELDVSKRAVADRARFPATIDDIAPDGDRLAIRLLDVDPDERGDDLDDLESATPITLPYSPGDPSPAQHRWSYIENSHFLTTSRDASFRHPGPDYLDEDIETLEQAHRRDPTNPHIPALLGESYLELGDEEAADRAFEKAVSAPNAVWHDLIAVASVIESAGASDHADAAFERGVEKMHQTGVSPKRMYAILARVEILMEPTGDDSVIHQALEAEDTDEVHRLSKRAARVTPYVESGDFAWFTLANWFDEQGEPQRADYWREVADENRRHTRGLFAPQGVDHGLLFGGSVGLGLLLLTILIGLRGGVARRRFRDRTDGDGPGRWVPKLRRRDLVIPLVAFGLLLATPYYINMHVEAIDAQAVAPIPPMMDGMAAPHGIAWLENLEKSDARGRLLHTAYLEQQALTAGEELPEKEPVVGDVIGAIYADARNAQFDYLAGGEIPDFVTAAETIDGGGGLFGPSEPDHYNLFVTVFGLLIAHSLLLLGASLLGGLFPGVAKKILLVVPGGNRRLAPVGAVALIALLAAVGTIAGLDRILYVLSKPGFLSYFGLQSLTELAHEPSRAWAWATLLAVVAYQAAMITWELRNDDG